MITHTDLFRRVAALAALALVSAPARSSLHAQARATQAGLPATRPATSDTAPPSRSPYGGFRLRSIGPGMISGRITDLAVDPRDKKIWYVGAAAGGVWKTTNSGTTWTPVFDRQSTYSIGSVVVDSKHPNVVWVGTGENNAQRAVSYGDGVYKSVDA